MELAKWQGSNLSNTILYTAAGIKILQLCNEFTLKTCLSSKLIDTTEWSITDRLENRSENLGPYGAVMRVRRRCT